MGCKKNRKKNSKIKKQQNFTHRELCFDLAEAKGTNFIEVPLGSVWLNRFEGPGQADVITIKPSYNKFNLDIYEVKVTKSDLLNDIKSEKYKKYLQHCNRLYFAVKSGICNKEDIPADIGLIVRGEKGWKTIKTAKKRNFESFSEEMLLSLVFFKGRVFNPRRKKLSNFYKIDYVDKDNLKYFGKKIGSKILKYNDLNLKFKNLLYIASDRIPFPSEEEREKFEDYWENITYYR